MFLNDPAAVAKDVPSMAAAGVRRHRPRSSSSSTASTRCTPQVAPHVPLAMPLRTQFYGMREFAIHDPDGHLITFAERVGAE